jgi:hypothetical protein
MTECDELTQVKRAEIDIVGENILSPRRSYTSGWSAEQVWRRTGDVMKDHSTRMLWKYSN